MIRTKLKDVCDRITVGHVGPMAEEYTEEGVPFLRSQNITPFSLHLHDIKYVPPTFHEKLKKSALRPGDVAVVRTGYPGTACVIPESLPEANCADLVVITPSEKLNPYYLAAIFNSAWGKSSVAGNLVGVAQQHFNVGAAREMEIALPSRAMQDQIAGILSAYDDLIENNQRRIKILEEMARSLYREWFVHFRFPGHDKVKMVSSPLGPIPQGWEVKPLEELATVTMGLSPKGDTYNEEENGTPLVNGPVEFGDRFTKRMKWTTEPTKFCKEGDLVVCVRGSTTGKYVKSDGVYSLGRGVCGISSKYQCFIELLFENELPTLLGQTSGSTFPSWTGPQLKSHRVLSPPPEVSARFDALVKPMSATVLRYSRQIQNLRRTRDLLLPRLLSGNLDLN
ncbi:MAG TPA: restriction endonuclease subunit S [Nitrospira sp.]|nr:restriction endonuclease subunit S [Nitrospira sp.]HRB16939.1 restriction endonuclease subunit S [Nitrospira sp.]